MSDLERLLEIARELPPEEVHVLLSIAKQMTDALSDEEFLRKINSAPPIDIDEATAADLRSALAERGATISHRRLKRELGLP